MVEKIIDIKKAKKEILKKELIEKIITDTKYWSSTREQVISFWKKEISLTKKLNRYYYGLKEMDFFLYSNDSICIRSLGLVDYNEEEFSEELTKEPTKEIEEPLYAENYLKLFPLGESATGRCIKTNLEKTIKEQEIIIDFLFKAIKEGK